jgi:hypothetical protein
MKFDLPCIDDLFTPLSLRALVRRVRILYRTAVRTRRRRLHPLARHGLVESEINVVSRSNNVVQVGCRPVVDGAIIDHDTLRIDNDHLRRRLRVVKMADLPAWVEQCSGRRGPHFRQILVLFARGHVSLFAWRRRDNREPDDVLAGPLLSPAYFSQMFDQSTGVAPHQFVLRARVERAKELLVKEVARVLDVAIACGFQTQQHFASVFRALCKMSPMQFRQARLA